MKKFHRFITNSDFSDKKIVLHDSEVIFQIENILHIQKNEKFVICNGEGKDALVTYRDKKADGLHLEIQEIFDSSMEPPIRVTLFCAILKGDHFEWVAQKCTEVGVFQIIPIITHRTVKLSLRHDRIQKIMKEAAEQSGRGRVPTLGDPLSFQEAIGLTKNYDKSFFLDFSAKAHLSYGVPTQKMNVALFIGPEGGFETKEQEAALTAGCTLAHLGSRVLRAETAALVGTFLLSGDR